MSVKSSLAFKRDNPSRERAISNRIDRQATRLLALAEVVKSTKASSALRSIARDMQAVAADHHPRQQHFATINSADKKCIALIDSRTSENYRLLPCSEARAMSIKEPKSVSRWRVSEWPTLALAIEYAQGFNKIHRKMRAEDIAHRRRLAPFQRQLNTFQARLERKAITARRKEVAADKSSTGVAS